MEDVAAPTLAPSAAADEPSSDVMAAARARIAARHSGITISLADHAERVAKKNMRGRSSDTQTVAERMAALRRRISERRHAVAADGDARGAAAGGLHQREASIGVEGRGRGPICIGGDGLEASATPISPTSNEDNKMHQLDESVDGVNTASAGEANGDGGSFAATAGSNGGGGNNAASHAAATWAWHARGRGGADGEGRRLSAV